MSRISMPRSSQPMRPCARTLRTAGSAMLLAVALAMTMAPGASAQAVEPPVSADTESGVDAATRPGDDFFAYANGAWLSSTAIPAGKDRWSVRSEIDEQTRQQIAALFADAGAAPAGSTTRKLADFRAAYLDQAAIERRGIAPIRPMLEAIDRVADKAALTRLLGAGLPADVDPLNLGVYNSAHPLGLAVEEGNNGERLPVAYLLQGGLGLPDRDDYSATEARAQALRTAYQAYIVHQLAQAGIAPAEQRGRAVMALETAIAQSHASRAATENDHNADNLWTRAAFAREAPGMDWSAFFAAAGLAQQESFVVWQPGAVKGLAALVATEPLQAWQDYLRFHVIDRYADVLPGVYAEAALTLHGAAAGGAAQPVPRAQRALEVTQAALGEALGRMYVERYFPPERKARVQAIVAKVIAAFRQRVAAATWMAPATRTVALAKLDSIYFGIGNPEQWLDYSGLEVDPTDAAGNRRRLADWNYRRAVARLGRPVDKHEWLIPPQMVGAVLIFQQNAYNFPAALLQPPKFDAAASDAANYGAIGAIVGHEVTHFIDLLGAEYELDGRNRRWWTQQDVSTFGSLCEPLQRQFSGYHPFADASVDGKRTLSENVADLGGLAAAFDAYRGTLGARATDPDTVRAQDRQFFIGFARAWRSKLSDAAMRTQIATNDHAPESYRIATVRNIDAWYAAFDVQPGQRLYLEPAARVHIW